MRAYEVPCLGPFHLTLGVHSCLHRRRSLVSLRAFWKLEQ